MHHARRVYGGERQGQPGSQPGQLRPVQRAALAWLDADQVARAGLDAVAAGRVLAVPGAQYKSVVSLTRVVPRAVVRSAAAAVRRNSVG